MPPYRRGAAGSCGTSVRPRGLNTNRNTEFVILRSPENISDVDPDTEPDWDGEYSAKNNKTNKPAKKVTRSMGPAGDVGLLVDLEDYSPRGPSRKRRRAKGGSISNMSAVGDRVSFAESIVSGGGGFGLSEEDSEDDDAPPSCRKTSRIAGGSRANRKKGKARARADTMVCASSAGRRSATQRIETAQGKKYRGTASYEARTAEKVAEIAAKKAPHLVALARINAEAEQLREQLRMKKQEREIMEKVWGVVSSRKKSQIGPGKKLGKPKTTVWITDSEDDGPLEFSGSIEVGRQMSLLGKELQEESEGWNSLFDESEKMSGVDLIKVDKPTLHQPKQRLSGKSQETSETWEKSQNQAEKSKLCFEENADGELVERTGSEATAGFPASDGDSVFGASKAVQVLGGEGKFKETKSVRKSGISQQEKQGPSDSQSIQEEAKKGQHYGKKRKYPFEANTDGELPGQKGSEITPEFPVSDDDILFDDSETHSRQESRKKLKKSIEVLQVKPAEEFGVRPESKRPAGNSLGLQDENVSNERRAECDEPGDTKKSSSHLSDWQRLREKVGGGHQEFAASEPDAGDEVEQRDIDVLHLSLQEAVGGGGGTSAREVLEDLRATGGLKLLDGKQSGGGAEGELDRLDEEVDIFLKECGINSASPQDHRKSPGGYDVDLFDPLSEMSWGNLVGVGGEGDSSTMAGHAITDSMPTGLGAPAGELELVHKQLEKDLGFMDWDKAEAEFLKFDDDSLLPPAVGDPRKDVGFAGGEEQACGMEDRIQPLKPQHSPPGLLRQDIPEENAPEKVLGCLDQEKMGHHFGRPGGWKNATSGEDDRAKIYNPVRVHKPRNNGRERVRSRPYTAREISEYCLDSLFETYNDEIEEMEMKADESMKSSVARSGCGGRGSGTKGQGKGIGNTPKEKPKLGVGFRDVAPGSLELREIAKRKKVESKMADATTRSLELAGQKKERRGFVGVDDSSSGGAHEMIDPGKTVPDSVSLNVYPTELPDHPMKYLQASHDQGSSIDKVLDSDSVVFPGESAKFYRVELPDGSMGYVLAEMVSGEWCMAFITDAPGDGYRKTQQSPPQLDSDWGLLSEAEESAWQSPKGAPQSGSQERARRDSPDTRTRASRDGGGGRNLRPEWRRNRSPVLNRAFQEANCGNAKEEELQNQGSKGQKLDTRDRCADFNDWD